MATVQLDQEISLDLMDGEGVIYSEKLTKLVQAGLFNKKYECRFIITNKRIANVFYPKKGETLPVENIEYSNIKKTKHVESDETGTIFHIVMKAGKTQAFLIWATKKEAVKGIRKGILGGLGEMAKLGFDNLSTIARSQEVTAAIMEHERKAANSGIGGRIDQKEVDSINKKYAEGTFKFNKDWDELFGMSKSISETTSHREKCNTILAIISEAIKKHGAK